jgi:two-component system, OmpR family, response regulator
MVRARPVVLVVEDDRAICELLQEVLEEVGYAVEGADDSAAAQARLAAGDIGLVVLDRRLPDQDGLELCRWLRRWEQQQAGHVPIIVVTASSGEGAQQASRAAGADDHVTKPFDLGQLLERVQAQLPLRRGLFIG